MRHLIRLITVRYLRAAPTRTLLTIFGIVLGVSVVVAIDVVNGSVMASFRGSVDQVAGKTALTVGEGTGVAEELLENVRGVEGVSVAVPIIHETARDVGSGTQLTVLGVDTVADSKVRDYDITADDVKIEDDLAFLNDPKGVLVTTSYAERSGLKAGDIIKLETASGVSDFNVRGTLAARGVAKVFGGDLLLMDVYAAQVAFGRGKRFDYIDVVPAEGTRVEKLADRIRSATGNRAAVARPERRSQEAEQILGGFKLGLSLASMVAIFVGAFIVYNALAIAVAQRRKEIGILRALGVTRRQIMSLFIGEGVLIGSIGAALGVAAGVGLARVVVSLVGSTLSALYVKVQPDQIYVTHMQLIVGVAIGVSASFIAAFFPASRAAYVEPATAMRKKADSSDVALTDGAAAVKSGLAAVVGALIAAWFAHARESSALGYVAAGCLALAVALLAPALARGLGTAARRLTARRGPVLRMGVLGFERNSGRNAVAIAALGLALANVINIGFFLGSIKDNTVQWIDRTIRADVLVFAGRQVAGKFERPIADTLREELSAQPGVEFVDAMRMTRQRYRDQPFFITSYDLANYRRHNEIPVVDGDIERAMPEIIAGTGLMASETFTRRFKVKLGDVLSLQTLDGPRDFKISLVYADYASELGILAMTHDAYVRHWKDTLVDVYWVYVKKGTAVEPVRQAIAADVGTKQRLMVVANGEYKKEVMGFIDRSFSLMRATELVAIIVALLGIVNTLVVSVLDRRMEIGILKAIGAARRQVQQMFMIEASLLGFAASVLGVAFGTVLSMYVVKELLHFEIGQQIAWKFSTLTVLETFFVAQVVAVVGAWAPTRSAATLDVVDALSYE